MDKFTIPSTHNPTVTFTGNKDFLETKEPAFSPKRLVLDFVSEMSMLLANFHRKQQRKYRDFANELLNKKDETTGNIPRVSRNRIGISEAIIESILQRLDVFEQECGYLNNSVSLNSLSQHLETNSSYLSRIINHTKGKTFKQYLNELRVQFAYDEMKRNPKLRKYTIEALAHEFGFKSAENFSKKFEGVYRIYPSRYLRDLRKG